MMRRAFLIPVLLSLLVMILAACDAIAADSSIVVKADEVAVVYNQTTGALDSILSAGSYDIQPLSQGVMFYPLFWQVYAFRDNETMNDGALGGDAIEARTLDETTVRVSLSLVFRVNADDIDVIFDSWGTDDYRTGYIRPTARRVVLGLMDDFTAETLINLPLSELQQQLDTLLRAEFEANGFLLQRVDLTSISLSESP